MSDETTARDLENAATLLRERGWCQHAGEDGYGRLCAVYALNFVTRTASRYDAAKRALRRHIGRRDIPRWNDATDITSGRVTAALEAAASDLRSRASS